MHVIMYGLTFLKQKMNRRKVIIIILLILLVVLVIWLLPLKSQPKVDCGTSTTNVSLSFINYEEEALPILIGDKTSQLINHSAYKLSYNKDYKVPNWVFYELLREELNGEAERSNKFRPDPFISSLESASLKDYQKSGYDRGHIAPAADFNWNSEAKDESFFLSNMCPQTPSFNRGIWKRLEEQVRDWAARDSAICVVAGPVLPFSAIEEYQSIGTGRVIVPKLFYKVILSAFRNKPCMIGFVMPNDNTIDNLQSFAVSIDSIESLTQIDFFSILPDTLENKLESSFDLNDWF